MVWKNQSKMTIFLTFSFIQFNLQLIKIYLHFLPHYFILLIFRYFNIPMCPIPIWVHSSTYGDCSCSGMFIRVRNSYSWVFFWGVNKFKFHISYSIIKKTLPIKLTISNIKEKEKESGLKNN